MSSTDASSRRRLSPRLERIRRGALWTALVLALLIFGLDRYAAFAHRPAADATRIALYTTSWCGYCAALRQQLDSAGVEYTEYDVEKSLAGQMGFWALRARGVPVSVVGPQIIHGYQEVALESALAELGYPVDLVTLARH
ncbi:MAG TPA: glutaredoxin domain-containing protein [Steroidobacteraceae bacterium]|nr:glutaredoxin domain-containing protein [Steroidobacteraceae bacterium]